MKSSLRTFQRGSKLFLRHYWYKYLLRNPKWNGGQSPSGKGGCVMKIYVTLLVLVAWVWAGPRHFFVEFNSCEFH